MIHLPHSLDPLLPSSGSVQPSQVPWLLTVTVRPGRTALCYSVEWGTCVSGGGSLACVAECTRCVRACAYACACSHLLLLPTQNTEKILLLAGPKPEADPGTPALWVSSLGCFPPSRQQRGPPIHCRCVELLGSFSLLVPPAIAHCSPTCLKDSWQSDHQPVMAWQ